MYHNNECENKLIYIYILVLWPSMWRHGRIGRWVVTQGPQRKSHLMTSCHNPTPRWEKAAATPLLSPAVLRVMMKRLKPCSGPVVGTHPLLIPSFSAVPRTTPGQVVLYRRGSSHQGGVGDF